MWRYTLRDLTPEDDPETWATTLAARKAGASGFLATPARRRSSTGGVCAATRCGVGREPVTRHPQNRVSGEGRSGAGGQPLELVGQLDVRPGHEERQAVRLVEGRAITAGGPLPRQSGPEALGEAAPFVLDVVQCPSSPHGKIGRGIPTSKSCSHCPKLTQRAPCACATLGIPPRVRPLRPPRERDEEGALHLS